jgi:hypothetical protein
VPAATRAILEKSTLGRALLDWFSSWPVALSSRRPVENSHVWIEVAQGCLTFHSDYCFAAGAEMTAQLVAHEVGHFLAVPQERLLVPNLGLSRFVPGGIDKDNPLSFPLTPDKLAEEARVCAHQVTLSAYLANVHIAKRALSYTLDETLGEWMRRMDVVRGSV